MIPADMEQYSISTQNQKLIQNLGTTSHHAWDGRGCRNPTREHSDSRKQGIIGYSLYISTCDDCIRFRKITGILSRMVSVPVQHNRRVCLGPWQPSIIIETHQGPFCLQDDRLKSQTTKFKQIKICSIQVSSSERNEIKLHCFNLNEFFKMLFANIQLYLILWYILFQALTLLRFVLGAKIWL